MKPVSAGIKSQYSNLNELTLIHMNTMHLTSIYPIIKLSLLPKHSCITNAQYKIIYAFSVSNLHPACLTYLNSVVELKEATEIDRPVQSVLEENANK
jgi:hypothetical protein